MFASFAIFAAEALRNFGRGFAANYTGASELYSGVAI
jgi:hypothetical protein